MLHGIRKADGCGIRKAAGTIRQKGKLVQGRKGSVIIEKNFFIIERNVVIIGRNFVFIDIVSVTIDTIFVIIDTVFVVTDIVLRPNQPGSPLKCLR
jgi:hypothetical protein